MRRKDGRRRNRREVGSRAESGWREHEKKSEAKGTAQKRKEQADGKRTAMGWRPFKPGRIRAQNIGEGEAIPEGGGPGLTVGG